MIKKILVSIGVLFSFFLMFFLGFDKINILAMGNFDNSIGTIPVQMDIDNYETGNLFQYDMLQARYNLNTVTTFNGNDITLISSSTSDFKTKYAIITDNIIDVFKSNSIYTISFNYTITNKTSNDYFNYVALFTSNGEVAKLSNFNKPYLTFNSNILNNHTNVYIGLYISNESLTDAVYTFNNFMIYEGEYDLNKIYEHPFKFGYNASLSYSINSSYDYTSVEYYFNDLTFTKNTDLSSSGYLIENYYLPFNIDSKGYISLPNISFGISSISSNSSDIIYSLQLELTPVFNAYYKGEYTTNIYTKLNYMSNDLFFSGITFSGCKSTSCNNTINAGNLSLTNPKTLAVTELNNTGNISTTNISTYYNDDIKNRNYFEYNNYLNVGFRIGDLAENYNKMNGINYTFGISSLASRIVDNQTTTTPLPDNELTTDKYNTCSAWYDIPCQLGNAITYVIYEAPIISPVLTFIVSFITMFSSLVSFVDLFRSFGIVFGCFIIYMFINLLHKYSK